MKINFFSFFNLKFSINFQFKVTSELINLQKFIGHSTIHSNHFTYKFISYQQNKKPKIPQKILLEGKNTKIKNSNKKKKKF